MFLADLDLLHAVWLPTVAGSSSASFGRVTGVLSGSRVRWLGDTAGIGFKKFVDCLWGWNVPETWKVALR